MTADEAQELIVAINNHWFFSCNDVEANIAAEWVEKIINGFIDKTATQSVNLGDISDGYHTFNELYEHRNLLFINLCLNSPMPCWIKKEEDFPGYFCLYLKLFSGQISYHIPNKYRYLIEDRATGYPEQWDGHSSLDVIERLQEHANQEEM